MSYDQDDIREIFRRAFEQQSRPERNTNPPRPNNTNPPPPRPRPQTPSLPDGWWRNRWLWVAGIIIGLIMSFSWIAQTWTDWLWFRNMEYANVWVTQWGAQAVTFTLFFLISYLFLIMNGRIASKGAIATSSGFRPAQFSGFKWLLRLGSGMLAFMFASGAAAYSQQFLRFIYQTGAEVVDPIYGRPISFYFYNLPVFQILRGWFLPLCIFTMLGIFGIYALNNIEALRRGEWRPQQLAPLRKHLAVLAGLTAILVAVGHLISRYTLLFSSNNPVVNGLGYTDYTITSRVHIILAVLMGLLALVLLSNFRKVRIRPIIMLLSAWMITAFVGLGLIPPLIQAWVVNPNQFARESTFIDHDIQFTRKAYNLDRIIQRDFGEIEPLSTAALADNEASLANIRLWDYRVLPKNYERLQSLRAYYQFGNDVDIDRYEINGETRQVMLAAREMNQDLLPSEANTWINRKLEFTHGYGIVMNPVDRFTKDGHPEFWVSGIPAETQFESLALTRPQIYYGERMDEVVYAGSKQEEIDNNKLRSSYEGVGGVPAGNIFRRLAMAVRFGDINLLLSNDITPDTHIMYHRTIRDRIERITPFLTIDHDPYLVVHDGRLVWIVDAYTTSATYPYSHPIRSDAQANAQRGSADPYGQLLQANELSRDTNYIRNSVKITVDAYDGTVSYYLTDTDDPLIATYAKIYPNLFNKTVANDMPAGLRAHLRYPETLFRIQAQQYRKYHMDETRTFYNQSDLWSIPQEKFSNDQTQEMEPYYVIFRLPGEEESEYLLIQPYAPDGRPNMVAWIAARNDYPYNGELIAYNWNDQTVQGPENIEARIDQDPEISSQISLWDQSGSNVIRGNLIIVPLNKSFLYVEPLYIESSAAKTAIPELKQVIVASESSVVMRNTLGEALAELVDDDLSILGIELPDPDPAAGDAPANSTLDGTESVDVLIESANRYFEAAQAAQQTGDWATYGEQLALLEQILKQLSALSGQ